MRNGNYAASVSLIMPYSNWGNIIQERLLLSVTAYNISTYDIFYLTTGLW